MATIIPDTYRLLLVEDDQDHVILVRRLLAKSDLDVKLDVAGSAVEAMAAIKGTRYHVILVDFGLPDCTGTASVVALKKQSPASPIIVLTSSSERWLTEEALAFGAEDVFVKSDVSPELLAHAIRRALLRHGFNLRSQLSESRQQSNTSEVVSKLEFLIDRCTRGTLQMPVEELVEEVKSIRSELVTLALKLGDSATKDR